MDILINDVNIFGNNDIEIVYQASNGTVNINQLTGVVTYYPNTDFAGVDSFAYSICNAYGQCGQAVVYLYVEEIILPPQIFTPNDNGQNDYFEINNIEKYDNVSLIVFNRWGNKVYESNNYMNDWDGKANVSGVFGDKPLPVGTYFYVLNYGENRSVTGFVYLKR
jgi:gliding motility-associated-like protein